MFIGEYSHKLDEKGRIALPKKFRDSLKGGVVVTRGLDKCLFVYTLDEWKKLAEKLIEMPIVQSDTRAFTRLVLAGAMDLEMDKLGRIILPEYLRNYAQLSKDVVITGLYNRLEVWDEQLWTDYASKTTADSVEIAERLGGLGI